MKMCAVRIAVVMTVFNRVEKTGVCIQSILNENREGKFRLSFYITNDGSSDSTQERLDIFKEENPGSDFFVLQGTGSLFWNKGMHLAFGEALKTEYDYYLWVNNDVEFHEGFLEKLIEDAEKARSECQLFLICGSVSYRDREELSYGGAISLSRINPYKRKRITPNGFLQKCDYMNGNCVLIPVQTAKNVGNLDERYEHAYGDYDYGFRVIANGGQPYVASSYVGVCDRNPQIGTWEDPSVPIMVRLEKKNAPTGVPVKSQWLFLCKWFPALRLYYLCTPYIRIVASSLQYKINPGFSKIKKKDF